MAVVLLHFGNQCCLRPLDHLGGHALGSVALQDAAVRCVDDADSSRIPRTTEARGVHGDAAVVIEVEGQDDARLPRAAAPGGAGVRRLDAPCLLHGDGSPTGIGHLVPEVVAAVEAGHEAEVPHLAGVDGLCGLKLCFGGVFHAHVLVILRAGMRSARICVRTISGATRQQPLRHMACG